MPGRTNNRRKRALKRNKKKLALFRWKQAGPAARMKMKAPGPGMNRKRRGGAPMTALASKAALAAMNYLAPGLQPAATGAMSVWDAMTGGSIRKHGDYKVSMNSLISSGPVPNFGSNEIRVKHREYLGPVNGTTIFTNTSYPLNPGMATTFPWLSQLAANYEQYKMHGIIFEYVTTSATAVSSTNTALGQVIMASDYDALDAPYASSRQMLTALFSNYGVPCSNLTHAIECATRKSFSEVLYVRQGAIPAGADLRLYDLANFQIATEGMQAGVTQIGGLWISYDVTFMKPVLQDASTETQSTVILSQVSGTTGGFSSTPVIQGNLQVGWSIASAQSVANINFPGTNVGDVISMNLSSNSNTSAVSFTASAAFSVLNSINIFPGGALSNVVVQRILPSAAPPDVSWTCTRSGTTSWSTALVCTTLTASSATWPWGTIPAPILAPDIRGRVPRPLAHTSFIPCDDRKGEVDKKTEVPAEVKTSDRAHVSFTEQLHRERERDEEELAFYRRTFPASASPQNRPGFRDPVVLTADKVL